MTKYIDANLLIRKIRGLIRLENLNFAALGGGGQTFCINTLEWVLKQIDSLQQEQPEVDIDEEIEKGWEELEKDYSPSALDKSYMIVSGLVGEKQFSRIARHFYELGLNARKEENK